MNLDWTGLGSVAREFGLDWIFLTQSISYSMTDYHNSVRSVWHYVAPFSRLIGERRTKINPWASVFCSGVAV